MAGVGTETYSGASDKALVVALHASTRSPGSLDWIVKRTQALRPDAHVMRPQLPLNRFSFAPAVQIARDVLRKVEEQIEYRAAQGWPEFDEIILMGHSMGALLARKVYVLAGPESSEARFEGSLEGSVPAGERPWFGKVKRIILFAGMNRGWTITHHLHPLESFGWWIGSLLGDTLLALTGDRARLVILNIRRGAPFLTSLRLQWLALERTLARKSGGKEGTALTVQLLGTIDDKVAPTDNVDLATGREFVYLDVPFSGHSNVIEMDATPAGLARAQVFARALCEDAASLRLGNLAPDFENLLERRDDVEHVIFVMHGIRDEGYWTEKVARRVQNLGAAPPKYYGSETSTYGYFPMLSFLLPGQRRKKVRWLMDQYVEAKSLYPEARFSYIGHSNGTYLAARALVDYPVCRFDRVVFAGSVVRTDYDWSRVIGRGQVEAVLNYVATADSVVAWLPGAWEMVGLQDIGSAGFRGFCDASPQVYQRRYVRGGHSCAREEMNWDDIARFIVLPLPPPEDFRRVSGTQSRVVVALAAVAPLLWAVAISLLIEGGFWLWGRPHGGYLLAIYLWIVWKVLTRV